MNERTDNLTVEVIKDKKDFIVNEILTNNTELDNNILSIDVIDMHVSMLSSMIIERVIEQAIDETNRYLWVIKKHNSVIN